jgi:hypothetical protein
MTFSTNRRGLQWLERLTILATTVCLSPTVGWMRCLTVGLRAPTTVGTAVGFATVVAHDGRPQPSWRTAAAVPQPPPALPPAARPPSRLVFLFLIILENLEISFSI